jgi:hypothetical protein
MNTLINGWSQGRATGASEQEIGAGEPATDEEIDALLAGLTEQDKKKAARAIENAPPPEPHQ